MVQDKRRRWRAANALAWYEVEELTNGVGDRVSGLRGGAKNQRDGRRGQCSRKADATLTPQRRRGDPGREVCEHAINRADGHRCRAQDRD
jgi:hypothetical protein